MRAKLEQKLEIYKIQKGEMRKKLSIANFSVQLRSTNRLNGHDLQHYTKVLQTMFQIQDKEKISVVRPHIGRINGCGWRGRERCWRGSRRGGRG